MTFDTQEAVRPPMVVTERGITLILNQKSYTVASTHSNFSLLKAAIRDQNWAEVESLATVEEAMKTYAKDNISVHDGKVFYKSPHTGEEEECDGFVVNKILQFMSEGLDPEPLVNFLNKVMRNPSFRVIKDLYTFLSNKNMPIDPDGDFYGYKAIKRNWMDKHSGRLDNSIGQTLVFERRRVDDNPQRDCSYGLHVGSLQYVKGFTYGDDRIVIVKVNPEDVVAVPEYDTTKLRCCRYTVISEYQGILPDTTYQDGDDLTPEGVGHDEDTTEEWEDEYCEECDEYIDDCTCDDDVDEYDDYDDELDLNDGY